MSKYSLNTTLASTQESSYEEPIELTLIEGLKPSIRRWLRKTFNVRNLEDLAQLSITQVLASPDLSQVGDDGKAICRKKLELWVQQAKMFASQRATWQTLATFVISLQSRQVGEHAEKRTTAYFLENNRSVTWSGIACNAVKELMLNHVEQILPMQVQAATPMKPEETNEIDAIAKHPSDGNPNTSSENTTPSDSSELVNESEPIAGNSAAELSPENPREAPEVAEETSEVMDQPLAVVGEFNATSGESSPVVDEPFATTDKPDAVTNESLSATSEPAPSPMQESLEDLSDEREARELDAEEASNAAAEVEPHPMVEVIAPLALQITQIKFCREVETEVTEDEASRIGSSTRVEPKEREKMREEIQVQIEGRSLPNPLQKAEPFDLEVTFQITGQGALELTERSSPYHSEAYVRNLQTDEFFSLGRSFVGSLQSPELTYTSQLKSVVLNNPGSYRIQIFTKIVGSSVQPILFELPSVQVV